MLTEEQKTQQILELGLYFTEINGVTFYFSSDKLLQRFLKKLDNAILTFNENFNRIYRYAYDIHLDDLALIRLYMSTEKRGFLIELNGVKITCLSQIRIHSVIKTG